MHRWFFRMPSQNEPHVYVLDRYSDSEKTTLQLTMTVDASKGHLVTHVVTMGASGAVSSEMLVEGVEVAKGVWVPQTVSDIYWSTGPDGRSVAHAYVSTNAEIHLQPPADDDQFTVASFQVADRVAIVRVDAEGSRSLWRSFGGEMRPRN